MNILLTGATGFVGKQLTIRLLENGHSVYAIIRNPKKAEKLGTSIPSHLQNDLNIINGDITLEKGGISNNTINVLKEKIHTVYHMAAFLSFHPHDKEKTFQVNLEGTRNILELAKQLKVKQFFHVSTAYTLGEKENAKEELHPVDNQFVNYYEESKCHAEHLVMQYKDFFKVSIFRPSIIIGDSITGEGDSTFALYGVIRSFELLKRRAERKKGLPENFKFLCNKDVTQNFVPVDYVVNGLMAALPYAKENTIYHLTNSNPPTNQLIFDLISESLHLTNLEMVPTDYQGELTLEEQKFNEPIGIFYKYWERSVLFDDSNMRQLLKDAQLEPLELTKDVLRKIIINSQRSTEVIPTI